MVALYYQLGLKEKMPEFITDVTVKIFKSGAFSGGIFTVVMYTAVLNKNWGITKKLYKVRGELAIIGTIITLSHNFIYGITKKHLINLFATPSETELKYIISKILTILMLVMLVPLTITSINKVRSKMSYANWKKVQRLAYPFYTLMYLEVLAVYLPEWKEELPSIIIYTVVFVAYVILRLRKYFIDKQNRNRA